MEGLIVEMSWQDLGKVVVLSVTGSVDTKAVKVKKRIVARLRWRMFAIGGRKTAWNNGEVLDGPPNTLSSRLIRCFW